MKCTQHILFMAIRHQVIVTNKVKKECYIIRQDNTQIFNNIFFFKYRIRQIKATETNK